MKRILKLLLKTGIFLLLLPLFIVFGAFIYLKYINPDAVSTMEAMTEFLEQSARNGNGFGGEEGFVVIDSDKQSSSSFFWIDNNNLVLRTDYSAHAVKDIDRNFVWNISTNTTKPLGTNAPLTCIANGRLFHVGVPGNQIRIPGEKRELEIFQSSLSEQDDKWVVLDSRKVTDIWKPPSEKYEMVWSQECRPWFRGKSGARTDLDTPEYRFTYLPEWGWIYRIPRIGRENVQQPSTKVGFFELREGIYFGQEGRKIEAHIDIPSEDLANLQIIYVGFLDKYWLANRLLNDSAKKKFLAFLDRSGEIKEVDWLAGWPEYSGIPMPTAKGIFWSGKDYRSTNSTVGKYGVFLLDGAGRVETIAEGIALNGKITSDGCNVAFHHSPRNDHGPGRTLKVFKACDSTVNAKELRNVKY